MIDKGNLPLNKSGLIDMPYPYFLLTKLDGDLHCPAGDLQRICIKYAVLPKAPGMLPQRFVSFQLGKDLLYIGIL